MFRTNYHAAQRRAQGVYTLLSFSFICFTWLFPLHLKAQTDSAKTISLQTTPANATKWADKINLRGYVQVRYNRLLETNPKLKCEQCDRSWGENGGFFLRRIRLIFSGNLSERVYFYIQPDFASSASATGLHFGQIRDAYFDVALDKQKAFRLRFGQSKVPYGFENMQSSQNRLPLDRNDALNSAASNERDLGVFFYWAPPEKRKLLAYLVNSGLKGSGDYGLFAFGLYNGATANRPESNNSPHVVTRFTYPVQLRNKQIFEVGVQAYQGHFDITKSSSSVKGATQFFERRVGGSFMWYPQPFGIQAEYNIGEGPEYDPLSNTILNKTLKGGYVQSMYYLPLKPIITGQKNLLIPFVRYQYYKGGKKFETDARRYLVDELEIGTEWQPFDNLECVAMYTFSNRTFEDGLLRNNAQKGRLLRIQVQLNF